MINIKMQPTEVHKLSPKITVIGVGGAGGNAVNNMISSNLEGCEFLVCNTDAQALDNSPSEGRVNSPTITMPLPSEPAISTPLTRINAIKLYKPMCTNLADHCCQSGPFSAGRF